MDAHLTPTIAPRSRIAARLKWVATLFAAFLILIILGYALIKWKVAAVTPRLHHPDAAVRVSAVKELGSMGPKASSAIPTLLDMLRNDESDEVTSAVGDALWRIGPDTSAGLIWLRARLKDPDAAVRTHAAFVLGSDRPFWALSFLKLRRPWVKEAVATLAGATRDEDKLVRWMAVVGIMRYAGPDTPEAVPTLAQALDDESDTTRHHAVIALGRIGPSAHTAVPALVKEMKKPYPPTPKDGDKLEWYRIYISKIHIGIALGKIGPSAIPELVGLLRDSDSSVRLATLTAFPNAGAEAVPRLAELLRDSNSGVRQTAAEAIGRFGPKAGNVAPTLIAALKDSDAAVRKTAVYALGNMGMEGKAAAPALAALLNDSTDSAISFDDMRFAIFAALSKIGPEAKAAVPALMQFISNEKQPEYFRAYAVNVLLKIAPETKASIPSPLIEHAEKIEKEENNFTQSSMDNWETDINPIYR